MFVPLYLANETDFSYFVVGASLAIMQAAGFIATPIAGHYSDKLGRKRVVIFSLGMTMIFLFFIGFSSSDLIFISGIAAVGFFIYAIRPVIQAWLLETTPKDMGGTSISMLFTIQGLGASVFPLAGGIIADAYGIMSVFYAMIVIILIANILTVFLKGSTPETA